MIAIKQGIRVVALAATALSAAAAGLSTNELGSLSFDELFFHVQRYGTTREKRENKRLARGELRTRGADSLAYLVRHAHVTNIWYGITAEYLVRRLDAAQAAPVLLDALESEHDQVRRYAAYFLGYYECPEHAGRILPLLDEEDGAGAAIRTLGKWKDRGAVPRILPHLEHEKERRRVTAANALGSIGARQAVPGLVAALADPYFTVRRAAGRALVSIGKPAERALLGVAGDDASGIARREAIRTLGTMRSRRAVRPLRRLLKADDRALRGEAARALLAIDPDDAPGWLRRAGINAGSAP